MTEEAEPQPDETPAPEPPEHGELVNRLIAEHGSLEQAFDQAKREAYGL